VVEFICRRILGTLFSLVPLRYFWGSSKYTDEYFQEHENSDILDLERDAKELILSRGYYCEEHFTNTLDGFILGLQRIPFEKKHRMEQIICLTMKTTRTMKA